MGYQFIHLETFSREPDKHGRSTSFVVDEAYRCLHACQHVAVPMAPTLVYGAPLADSREVHDAKAATAMTEAAGKARKIRQDQHTLATVVTSYPMTWEQMQGDANGADLLKDWQARTVAWLRNQFGGQLASVVMHTDEAHPHLHAIVLPDDPEMRAKRLHPGWTAKDAAVRVAKGGGTDGKAANAVGDRAYKEAMRAWQDSYWHAVGLPCGLARLGPQKRRLTRVAWQTEQAAARTTAELVRHAEAASVTVQAATNREAMAEAAAMKSRVAIAEAKRAMADAKVAADAADAIKVQAKKEARAILTDARHSARQVAAPMECIQ